MQGHYKTQTRAEKEAYEDLLHVDLTKRHELGLTRVTVATVVATTGRNRGAGLYSLAGEEGGAEGTRGLAGELDWNERTALQWRKGAQVLQVMDMPFF